MAYQIFDETMVDLTWPELEKQAKQNPLVILPISIIEQHGPHMDLAPDIYLVHNMAKTVTKYLNEKNVKCLIAPPMFWGISESTGCFPGTFSIRPETMIELLYDIVSSLDNWGFTKVFILNMHGDSLHIKTIIKGIQKIKCNINLDDICFILEEEVAPHFGLDGTEDYVLLYRSEMDGNCFSWSDYADIHAGGEETSSMLNFFPDSVIKEMLPNLTDSKITFEQLSNWNGNNARKLTPLGYCGNPSNFNTAEANKIDDFIAKSIAYQIERYLNSGDYVT